LSQKIRKQEREFMKVVTFIRMLVAMGLFSVVGISGVYAQSEIDPDHFDSPNTEPFPQPKAPANTQIGAIRYDGEFTLPHEVRCNGKNLPAGKYSVSLRSNGKVGQATLDQKGHTTEIAGIVQTPAAKQRNHSELVIVGNNSKGRTLSIIRVSGFDFVFDPKHSVDPSTESEGARVEKVLLTAIVPNKIVPSHASPRP
jgi:hypothetical protein